MESKFGSNYKEYKDVIIRSSQIGDDVMVGDDCFITNSIIGNHCSIERRSMIFNSTIGDYSYTGYNDVIKYSKIGKFTSMGWNVSSGGVNHDMKHLTMHPFPLKKKYGFIDDNEEFEGFQQELLIGNDVWVGSNVCILRNIHIGDGAVIGAGAVVTHDVGAYEIWAGVPAKRIGQRFSDEMIEKLLTLSWWDLPKSFIVEHLKQFKTELTTDSLDELIKLSKLI